LNLVPGILDRPNVPGSISFRHPEYEARWWWREFYRISYLGGREYYRPARLSVDFQEPSIITLSTDGQLPTASAGVGDLNIKALPIQSVLFRHNREKSWEFENRRKRAHYLNFIGPIVKSLVAHATKKAATRDGSDSIKKFWDGVDDDREESIEEFMRDGLRWAQVLGIVWACVDQDPNGDDNDPYAYWVSPLDIFDWGIDDDGEVEWLKQFVYTEAKRTWKDKITPVYRFRVWDKEMVTTYEVSPKGDETVVGRKPHSAGKVPFVPLFCQRDKEAVFPDGTPLMADACKLANAIYNYSSLKDEIGYKQTFSWLAVPDKRVDVLQIGLNTVFAYDPQQTNAVPTYVSPDASCAETLMNFISTGVEQLRQMLGVGRGRQEGSMQKSSADALELEDEDKRSILGDIASEAQSFEIRLAAMVDAYNTGGGSTRAKQETKVKYADDYDLRSFQDEVAEFLQFDKIGLSPEVNLRARQDLVKKKYADLPPAELDVLVASMEAQQQKELEAAAAAGAGERVTVDPTTGQPVPGSKPLDGKPPQGQSVKPMGNPTANRPLNAGSGQRSPAQAKTGTATGAADPGRG